MRRGTAPLLAAAAVLLLAAPAHAAGADYVGLGDSYSSGTGTAGSYDDNCQRTSLAYPSLIDPQLPGSGVNLSCSGARTQHITGEAQTPGNSVPQIDIPGGLGADTDYVTLQIGGNDAGFVDTLVSCANPLASCSDAIAQAEQTATVELPPKLNATYDAVRAKAPNATIVVVGYPRIFRPNQSCNTFFSSDEVNDLNAAADLLSSTIKGLAQARDLAYVDPRPAFIGHGACDSVEWINGLSFSQTSNSYHPKAAGHSNGYAPLVLAAINNVPRTTITSKPPAQSNTASPQFQFSSTVAGSGFQCRLDGGGYAACSSPRQFTGLSQGPHTLRVRAINPNGDPDQFPPSYTWTVDTVAPALSLDPGGPSGTVTAAAASFAFSAEAGATVECRLDAGSFSPCAGTASYSGLADGPHSFTVRATDAAGNAASAGRSWAIDTTPPHPTINAAPADPTASGTASFEFSVDDPVAVTECRLDSSLEQDFQPCASPVELTGLTEDDHVFEVRARDAVGNVGPVESFAWTVDSTASSASIASGPPALSNEPSAQFEFDVDDPSSTVECSLDGRAFQPCSSPTTYEGLEDGPHEVVLRATDAAGNVATDSYGWTVDTTAPGAAIDAGPPALTSETAAQLAFSSLDSGASFECRLDSASPAAFAPCHSPQALSGLTNGPHAFDVRAVDAAGNAGVPASRSWTVDTVAPTAAIGQRPDAASALRTAQFGFASSEPGSSFQCRLDSSDPGAFQPCSAPQPYAGLADGPHAFEVRATDPAGNAGPAASFAWSIDTVGPTVTFDAKPDLIDDASATFAFHASEGGSSFACRLDSAGPFFACSSPRTFTGLSDGPHTLELRATDPLGNSGPVASHSWNSDTIVPTAAIDSGPQGQVPSDGAEFRFSATEPGDFVCRIDGGAYEGCEESKSYAGLSQGPHTFDLRFTDAGSREATASRSWTVDTVPPSVTILTGPPGVTASTSAAFTFSASGGGAPQCRLDAGSFGPCSSPSSFSQIVGEGEHTFTVRSTDGAGNTASASRAWTVDRTPPSTALDSQPPPSSTSPDASFSFSSGDFDATFQCSLDGAQYSACTSPASFTGLGAGDHSFRVRAVDAAGNADPTPAAASWRVESQPSGGVQGKAGKKKKPRCRKPTGRKKKGKCRKR